MSNSSQLRASPRWRKYLIALMAGMFLCLMGVGASWLSKHLHKDAPVPKKMIQQVTIVTPPPPPPPPPPEQVKQPELKEEEIPREEVTETPPEPGPDQSSSPDLGVDAEGGAGGDGFGLVGKKGGRGLLGGGGYEQVVRQEINEIILESERLKHMAYVATITLRIGDDGQFEQIQIELASGDREVADLLKKLLEEKRRLSRPRPLEAASLVKLRVKSVL